MDSTPSSGIARKLYQQNWVNHKITFKLCSNEVGYDECLRSYNSSGNKRHLKGNPYGVQ